MPASEESFNNGVIFGFFGLNGAILFIASIFNESPWCFFGGLFLAGIWQLLGGKTS